MVPVVALETSGSMPSCSIIGPSTMPPPTPMRPAITPARSVRASAAAATCGCQLTSPITAWCASPDSLSGGVCLLLATRRRPASTLSSSRADTPSAVSAQYSRPHGLKPSKLRNPLPPRIRSSTISPAHTPASSPTSVASRPPSPVHAGAGVSDAARTLASIPPRPVEAPSAGGGVGGGGSRGCGRPGPSDLMSLPLSTASAPVRARLSASNCDQPLRKVVTVIADKSMVITSRMMGVGTA
mmetsp:Transcript_16359/g.53254  ORF Transcript_16359/g.53254 Transcript_16359/m.53254 type:complete len:241 (-) Transcript_16359:606-1328(-)|eukprot:scaffold1438_cov126-Isochrysis_galbana.AAC.8